MLAALILMTASILLTLHPLCPEIMHYDHDVFSAERRRLSMDDVLSGDLIYVFAFCLAGLVFAVGPFVVVHLLAARKTRNYANKTEQYIECGMDPIGDAWIRYSAVYYLYALVFVAFAVDVLYLIPVALVYNRIAEFVVRDFVEMLIFVGILSLVIVYAWKKGVFEWKRKQDNAQALKDCAALREVREAGRVAGARAGQLALAADLRPGLLRHRDDGGGRVALRPGPLRRRGLPALAAPGGFDDHRRHHQQEDGRRRQDALRPDARAQMGHRDGQLRHFRRAVRVPRPIRGGRRGG